MEGTNVFSTGFDYSNGIGSADFPKQPSQFTSSIKFYNCLNMPIYIGTREGIVYLLKPMNDKESKQFLYIEREIHYTTPPTEFVSSHYHPNGDEGIYSGVVEHGPSAKLQKYSFTRVYNTLEYKDLLAADALYFEAIDYVISLSTNDRQYLHLAAVWACNFVNYCYSVAADILENKDIPFNVIIPLINETTQKVHDINPKDAQTGSAVRWDKNIIEKQMNLMSSFPSKQAIYGMISKDIHEQNKQ